MKKKLIITITIIICLVIGGIFVYNFSSLYHNNDTISTQSESGKHMDIGKIVTPPFGWVDYCKRHPEDPQCE